MSNELLTPQQQAWINLAAQKTNILSTLNQKQLEASSILVNLKREDVKSYTIIEEGLATYRKIHSDMVETRKSFTNIINDKIIGAMMEPEKNVDPSKNADYIEVYNKGFKLKKEENDKVNLANNKNAEKGRFVAHIQNEYMRTAGLYRQWLRDEVTRIYESNLAAKIQDPKPALEQMKAWIATTQPQAPQKFSATYLNEQELYEVFNSEKMPDWKGIQAEAFKYMDELYENYDAALSNPEEAIKANQDEENLNKLQEKEKEEKTAALNTLVSSAETVMIQGPVIKSTLVVREINSWQWAKNVITAFYVNVANMDKYVRVKDWKNLKVGQMAAALGKYATETGHLADGLIYDKEEK